MSASVNFDPGCVVAPTAHGIIIMVECYCLGPGTTIKDFPLPSPEPIVGLSGTLSFQGLNWSWWRKRIVRPNTAICGMIGSTTESFYAFDVQGDGSPQLIPVEASFPAITIDALRFNLFPDLTLPTDFRFAGVLHRAG